MCPGAPSPESGRSASPPVHRPGAALQRTARRADCPPVSQQDPAPRNAYWASAAANLAASLAAPAAEEPKVSQAPPVAPGAEPVAANPGPLIRSVVLLLAAALLVPLLSDPERFFAAPVLVAALVASYVLLDLARIDVFDRANISPA